MKRKLIKFSKIIALTIIGLALPLFGGLYWPISDLEPPVKHETILIKSITVIDVVSGKLIKNQDIKIKSNRIIEIGLSDTVNNLDDSFIIDGHGKFIIPGLWDMHTHSTKQSEWLHHPLYIANGVTGVRDMSGQLNQEDSYWAGSTIRLKWNQELNNNKRITPRYVLQSSYQINGESSVPSNFPNFFKLKNEKDVPQLLSFYKNKNVDFIKVYYEIPPHSYRKLALEAPNYGIHLAGHKPMYVSLEEAITLGQRSFEHGRIFMFECSPLSDKLRTSQNYAEIFSKSKKSIIKDFDTTKSKQLMSLMRQYNTHWTPTLQTLKSDVNANNVEFLNNQNLKYIPYLKRKIWWGPSINNAAETNLSHEGKGVNLDFYKEVQKQVQMAKKIGVPIMAGTDVTDAYVFPGFSLHTELKDLTECGLTNLEAIQTATIVPAKYAGLQLDHGTIEIGKIADMVILEANPLANIENTSKINSVIINGIYYDGNKIEDLKSVTASNASSFHMNVKEAFSLLSSPLIRIQLAD